MNTHTHPLSKSEIARLLGISRTYVTLLAQGKRQPSQQLANRISQLQLTGEFSLGQVPSNVPAHPLVGKRGLEPRRLAAHDPKSCLSANSSTPPFLDAAAIPVMIYQLPSLSQDNSPCHRPCFLC